MGVNIIKYKKISVRIIAFICALVIGFCSPVGAVCSIQAQAAEVTSGLSWNIWQTIFTSLGFTLGLTESATAADASADLKEQLILDYASANNMTREEAENCINEGIIFNGPAVKVAENIWNALINFSKNTLAKESNFAPLSSTCISGYTSTEMAMYLQPYLQSLVNSDFVISIGALANACDCLKDDFLSNGCNFYVCPILSSTYVRFVFCPFDKDDRLYFKELSDGSAPFFHINNRYSDPAGYKPYCSFYINGSSDYADSTSGVSFTYGSDVLFFVDGYMFNFYDCFNAPLDVAGILDQGNVLTYDDFVIPHDILGSNITNKTNTALTKSIPKLYAGDMYDVLTPGREYDEDKKEVVGDVVLTIPPTDVLNGYNDGTVTWEKLMEVIDAIPVDTAAGTNILTDEFIDIQSEINANTGTIAGTVTEILDSLLELPLSIAKIIADAILSLFVPAEDFVDAQLNRMMDAFDMVGVSPYDMGNLFSDGGNPFHDIIVNVYGQDVVIVSFEFLPDFIEWFRPAIRGLMALFMLYYCVNQLLGLLRISGVIQGDNGSTLNYSGGAVKCY